jgi:hypothetical protein
MVGPMGRMGGPSASAWGAVAPLPRLHPPAPQRRMPWPCMQWNVSSFFQDKVEVIDPLLPTSRPGQQEYKGQTSELNGKRKGLLQPRAPYNLSLAPFVTCIGGGRVQSRPPGHLVPRANTKKNQISGLVEPWKPSPTPSPLGSLGHATKRGS